MQGTEILNEQVLLEFPELCWFSEDDLSFVICQVYSASVVNEGY